MESRGNREYLHQAQWYPFSQMHTSFLSIPRYSNYRNVIITKAEKCLLLLTVPQGDT